MNHVTIRIGAVTDTVTMNAGETTVQFDRSKMDDHEKGQLINTVLGWFGDKFQGQPNFRSV